MLGHHVHRVHVDVIDVGAFDGDFEKLHQNYQTESPFSCFSEQEKLEHELNKDGRSGQFWRIGVVAKGMADFDDGKPIMLTDLKLNYASAWKVLFELLA